MSYEGDAVDGGWTAVRRTSNHVSLYGKTSAWEDGAEEMGTQRQATAMTSWRCGEYGPWTLGMTGGATLSGRGGGW